MSQVGTLFNAELSRVIVNILNNASEKLLRHIEEAFQELELELR